MVKPPVVLMVGLMRQRKQFVHDNSWSWISDLAGQRIFRPPNVSGWDETRWLDTSSFRGRWIAANEVAGHDRIDESDPYDQDETATQAVDKALRFWGEPSVSNATRAELIAYAQDVEASATADWEQGTYRAMRQNALRMLIANSPDLQAC
jgi:hypothetical protein